MSLPDKFLLESEGLVGEIAIVSSPPHAEGHSQPSLEQYSKCPHCQSSFTSPMVGNEPYTALRISIPFIQMKDRGPSFDVPEYACMHYRKQI